MVPPGADEDEDGRLARRIVDAGGDPAAEAGLCRRLGPRLLAYGRRHLRDEAAAADLAQDVLMLVIERLRAGRVDAPERLASFALGACRLMVADRRRGERRRQALLETAAPWISEAAAAAAQTSSARVTEVDLQRLAGCVERLAMRDRTVVLASFFAGEGADSIGRALDATPGNVRVIRHRALKALESCMHGGDA